MKRRFTMQKPCLSCGRFFTLTSSASKHCKNEECVKRRRKFARARRAVQTTKE